MSDKMVTVFGGSGFIGRYVVQRLARAGARVTVAVRHVERAKFLKTMGNVGQVTPVACDVTDADSVARAVQGAGAVVNLVGILYPSGHGHDFDAVHHQAARTIAEAAKAAGAGALVQLSAIGADAEAESAYARSKAAGEAAVRAAFPEATILRPSVVFGPEDAFFNRFAAMARLSPALPLIGGGHTLFQPVYVGDVAEAVLRGLNDAGARGRTYELGGPKTYSFKALMELMLATVGRRRLLVPVPFCVAEMQGSLLQLLPAPPLTRDQVKLLKRDNVVAADALTLADLGIEPTAPETVLPAYLERFREGGHYSRYAA